LIIDCHGHYTTAPKALGEWRRRQLAGEDPGALAISADDIRDSIDNGQLKQQRERGADATIFSPIAGQMGHHLGTAQNSIDWSRTANDLIGRVCDLYPSNFIGVCQLPQSEGAPIEPCVEELARCVEELGFVGCNLNPDVSGGFWRTPAMTDRYFYPLYEKMVELDVPAMIHVSGSCNACIHHTGAHYINGDTTAFMQLIQGDLFKDFPTLRLIIPHGGGAVPYHWGRYRGLAQELGKGLLKDHLLGNVFFDTCVYHQAGIDCLTKVIPPSNVIFGSEMIGAVKGIDPETGHNYDDTKRYIDGTPHLTPEEKRAVFELNARRVYPRINKRLPLAA
jgi:4-oxalmesaconate hydratase